MKRISIYPLFLLFLCIACNDNQNKSDTAAAQNDLNAVTGFLQASLKGQYQEAKRFMLQDSVNEENLDAVSRIPVTPAERQGLAEASINIHSRKLVNDSTSIIIYSNSYTHQKDSLKVVRRGGNWLVDFKYLFNHDVNGNIPISQTKDTMVK